MGVGLSDVVERKYMLLSRDIVAIDSQAAKIMEYSKENVPYIALGEKLGLGTTDPLKMSITRIDA